jgi:hypothetical protein
MSFQKSNLIQEQMNDDDNYSYKIEEGGIDEQEEDSLCCGPDCWPQKERCGNRGRGQVWKTKGAAVAL